MTEGTVHTAMAARLHESSGAPRTDDDAERLLLRAAAASDHAAAAPPERTGDGSIVVRPVAPESLLSILLELTEAVRPERATFGLAVARGRTAPGSVEGAVVGTDAATTGALTALLATSLRSNRVAILAPGRRPMLEALMSLMIEFSDRMTDRQRQIIALARESETQQQVAKHLGVSRQAVNQSLTSAGWHHIRRAEDAARKGMAALAERAAPVGPERGEEP